MTRRVAFLDLETTGLNEEDERIVEVCVIQHDLNSEAHLGTFVWRANPLRAIGAKAKKAHGISLADLENEPTFDIIAGPIVGAIVNCDLAVAHNGFHFDFPFLSRECARVGVPFMWPKQIDTMTGARWATFNGKIPKLGELCAALDIPYDPALAHAAQYDVSVMAACFFEARRIGWSFA